MRSLEFDLPDEVMTDEHSVVVDIYTEKPGEDDDDGNPTPPKRTYYVQDADGDLQPKSGSQRAAESATTYESTHTLFLHGFAKVNIPIGAMAEARSDAIGAEHYTVVFVANWGTHLEIDLKAVGA